MECAPLLVREQRPLTEMPGEVRKLLPFLLLGFDTDINSVFMNGGAPSAINGRVYCKKSGVDLTRCCPYRKNDQVWVEQKNDTVVRCIVG